MDIEIGVNARPEAGRTRKLGISLHKYQNGCFSGDAVPQKAATGHRGSIRRWWRAAWSGSGESSSASREQRHINRSEWLSRLDGTALNRMVHWAGLQARYGTSKPYVYYFAHQPAEPATPCGYGCGAGHGAEIQYVFDNLDKDGRAWTAADRQLATRLARTWVNFARTGDPNGKGLPAWPVFDGTNARIVRIGAGAPAALPDFSLLGGRPE